MTREPLDLVSREAAEHPEEAAAAAAAAAAVIPEAVMPPLVSMLALVMVRVLRS